jgi:hypothetical protein
VNEKLLPSVVDRRAIIKIGGGAIATAAGLRRGSPALAQDASPVASPAAGVLGHYGVVRIRTLKPEVDTQALVADGRNQLLPLFRTIPGYDLYLLLANDQTRVRATLGVFADKTGADASTEKARDFAAAHADSYVDPTPRVVDGTIAVFDHSGLKSTTTVEGKYGVFRLLTVKPDQDAQTLIADSRVQLLPVVTAIPGYVFYLVLYNDQTRALTAFGVFADKAGADASTARAEDFITAHAKYYVNPSPEVIDGTVAIFDEAAR